MRDNGSVSARSLRKLPPISWFLFNIVNDKPLSQILHHRHVAELGACFNPMIDVLTCVHSFRSNCQHLNPFKSVNMSEFDPCKRSASSRLVNDIPDHTPDIAVSLRVIQRPKFGWGNSLSSYCFENSTSTFTLTPDYSTHNDQTKQTKIKKK